MRESLSKIDMIDKWHIQVSYTSVDAMIRITFFFFKQMQQEEKGGKTREKNKKGGRESWEGVQGNGNASTCHDGGSPSN